MHRIDALRGEALRVTTDCARLRSASFLDGRERFWSAERVETISPTDTGPALRMIFHVGFCGSTLLARLLDQSGRTFSLKEPQALNDLSSQAETLKPATAAGTGSRQWLAHLTHDLSLITPPGEALLVKPSNWVNGLIPSMAKAGLLHRALFLTMDRRAFIRACFRGGRERLAFATRLAALLATGLSESSRALSSALEDDGDPLARMARVAALLHAQQEWLFAATARGMQGEATGWLDFADLQRDSAGACRGAAAILDLPAEPDTVRLRSILQTHSKHPSQTFSPSMRAKQDIEVDRHHATRFDAALDWLGRAWPDAVSVAANR